MQRVYVLFQDDGVVFGHKVSIHFIRNKRKRWMKLVKIKNEETHKIYKSKKPEVTKKM